MVLDESKIDLRYVEEEKKKKKKRCRQVNADLRNREIRAQDSELMPKVGKWLSSSLGAWQMFWVLKSDLYFSLGFTIQFMSQSAKLGVIMKLCIKIQL